jgi:hypothetical protein
VILLKIRSCATGLCGAKSGAEWRSNREADDDDDQIPGDWWQLHADAGTLRTPPRFHSWIVLLMESSTDPTDPERTLAPCDPSSTLTKSYLRLLLLAFSSPFSFVSFAYTYTSLRLLVINSTEPIIMSGPYNNGGYPQQHSSYGSPDQSSQGYPPPNQQQWGGQQQGQQQGQPPYGGNQYPSQQSPYGQEYPPQQQQPYGYAPTGYGPPHQGGFQHGQAPPQQYGEAGQGQ